MKSPNSFKLPPAFLSQLGEFTTGYFLVTVNEQGQFETFVQSDNPVTRLGLLKFTGMILDTLESSLEQTMNSPVPESPSADIEITEGEDGEDDDSDGDGATV